MNEPVAGRMRLKMRSPRCGKYLGLLLHAPTQTACRDRQTAYCRQRPVCHTRFKVMTVQAWSSLDLEHLISVVPVILDALPQDSLMAVHATSRALRSRVQALIPRIIVTSWMATDKLDPHTWPALTSFTGALQLLNLPIKPWLHLHSLSMEQAGLSTDALQLLVSSSWPALQHLNLANTNLHSTRMTLLLQANWSGLKSLQLERCNLNSGSIAALTAASLPCLEAIDLAHNPLATADIAQFSKGNWPELRSLDLHRVACKGTFRKIMAWSTGETMKEFMQHLSSANWPKLAQLRLRSCDLNAANMEWLIKCPWQLQELDLSEQPLSQESCKIFKQGQ